MGNLVWVRMFGSLYIAPVLGPVLRSNQQKQTSSSVP